jgi:hypothetical protein
MPECRHEVAGYVYEVVAQVVSVIPWWARALLVVMGVLGHFAMRLVRLLMPDESKDRLSLWLAVLERREQAERQAAGALSDTRLEGGKHSITEPD